MTQSEFDRQAEITRLLLEGVGSTHVRSFNEEFRLAYTLGRDVSPALSGAPPALLERLCGGPDDVLRPVLPVHGGPPEAARQVGFL